MALDSVSQFQSAAQNAQKPLILLPENPSGEVVASGKALALAFEHMEKEPVVAFVQSFPGVYDLGFLPNPKEIRHDLAGTKDFVLIFDTSHNPIENVRTERDNESLRIYLTPKKGAIDPRDFSFVPADSKYDCAFLLGVRDKESLGALYEENPDLFFEIPLVNIDHKNANERFAQTNIIDVTASSVSEVLTNTLMNTEPAWINEEVAQCLLSGIILGTDSFQSPSTTPRSFQLAAMLIGEGADQHEIVRHLYKTQSFHVLKLFGRILSKLHLEEKSGLVWSMVTLEDFVQSRAEVHDLFSVLEKVRSHYSSGSYFLLLYEKKKGEIAGILRAKNTSVYEKLTATLPGEVQGDYFIFVKNRDLGEDYIHQLSDILSQV